MLGAIIGDIIGSVYESGHLKPIDFPLFTDKSRFTDDSLMTLATAKALAEMKKDNAFADGENYYIKFMRYYGRKYPNAGYGQAFFQWLFTDNPQPYNSFGNGSAMRVSPVGYAFDNMDDTLKQAEISAMVTHNHPDGIKGAQAVAGAVFLARTGSAKQDIKLFIEDEIGYPIDFNLEDLHKNYRFEIQCAKSVPQAVFAFLVSTGFEDAIRKAIYIGGDSDTIACIAGAIAEAYYKDIPDEIKQKALLFLNDELNRIIDEFNEFFIC